VDLDGRGAGGGENLSRRYGEGEDVGDVGFGVLVRTCRVEGQLD
jgi:hypothetical protein